MNEYQPKIKTMLDHVGVMLDEVKKIPPELRSDQLVEALDGIMHCYRGMDKELQLRDLICERLTKKLPNNRNYKSIELGTRFAPGHDRPLSNSQGELSWRTHECRKGFTSWPNRCCLRKWSPARRVGDGRWGIIVC